MQARSVIGRTLLLVLLALVPLRSAEGRQVSEGPRVARVQFVGDVALSKEQLVLRTRTRANRRLLGLPGATWWLWLHRFGNSVGGRVGRGLMASGEPPAMLEPSVVEADIERLRLFYDQEGFRRATITSQIDTLSSGDEVIVRFMIDPGPPTYIRTIRYGVVGDIPGGIREDLIDRSLLGRPASRGDTAFAVSAIRYSEPDLLEEGRRMLLFLRDQGYATTTRDSIHAVVIPATQDSFDVVFDVRLGPRFRLGDLHFDVSGPEEGTPARRDTLVLPAREDGLVPGAATVSTQGDRRFDPVMIRRTLRTIPGDWFDQSRVTDTKRRLDAIGVFAFTAVLPTVSDTVRMAALRLPVRFELQTRPRHQVQLEGFMLQRSGGLADSDNEIGTGVAVSYRNANVFGGGESFQLRSTGSIAADLGLQNGFTSAQWDVSGTLSYPYLVAPFGRLDRLLDLYDARTQISLSLLAARRDALRLVLRGRGNARLRLDMQHRPSLQSLVDVVDLSVSNPDTLAGFGDIFLKGVLASISDPVQQGQVVEDYTQPQINNAVRYTLRSGQVDPFRRSEGHANVWTFEVGGNLPYLLDRFVFSPGTVEGTIPGLPFFGGSSTDDRLLYRQYVRVSADLRRYRTQENGNVWAMKGIVGFAQPTGRANVIPFDRRFYSGGASSVRAWRLRELGPGRASFADSVGVGGTNILGGEIKLEASAEYRVIVLESLFEAQWQLALFADAGNIWFGPANPGTSDGRFRFDRFYREIGVGSGFGLRLAWEYLIVRLDAAYKVHDPLRRGDFLPDGLRDPVLQFGIGHTF